MEVKWKRMQLRRSQVSQTKATTHSWSFLKRSKRDNKEKLCHMQLMPDRDIGSKGEMNEKCYPDRRIDGTNAVD